MEKEVWKPVRGFEGFYEVSNLGKVKSLDVVYVTKNGRMLHRKGKTLKPTPIDFGYSTVTLTKNGKYKRFLVHRLVADAFIPNPENKPFVDHINTDATDYRACNLRWVTAKENANNPITKQRNNTNSHTQEVNRKRVLTHILHNTKTCAKAICQYTKENLFVAEYESIAEASRKTGISENNIRVSVKNANRTAYGYFWRYKDKATIT